MNNLLLKAYAKMQVLKTSILEDESGQDLVEYALVVGIISLGATATMPTVANAIAQLFNELATAINSVTFAT